MHSLSEIRRSFDAVMSVRTETVCRASASSAVIRPPVRADCPGKAADWGFGSINGWRSRSAPQFDRIWDDISDWLRLGGGPTTQPLRAALVQPERTKNRRDVCFRFTC